MRRILLIDAIGTVIEIDGSSLTDDGWSAVQQAWSGATVVAGAATSPSATVKAHGTITTGSMLASLSIDVTHAALAQRAGELLLLHAAGLAAPDGGVVVLVGPSGRGKTTAARVLGRHFGYVSDESIGIDADGTVLPYRKPLSIIENPFLKSQHSPRDLGLLPVDGVPLRVTALVLLDRDDSVDGVRVEPTDLAEGLVGLAEQASYLGRLRRPLGTLLSHIAAVGGVRRVVYRDAASLVPVLSALAAQQPNHPSIPSGWDSGPASAVPAMTEVMASTDVDAGPRYERVPVLDAQPLDRDRIALLLQRIDHAPQVVVLDGIAPAIWEATRQPATLATLVSATTTRYAEPPQRGIASLVAAAVEQMSAVGVLVRS
jgi:hypothetical protein